MTMRFPKWLMEEPFSVAFNPDGERGFDEVFRVTLWGGRRSVFERSYNGYGRSVSAAAKAADRERQRQKSKKQLTNTTRS